MGNLFGSLKKYWLTDFCVSYAEKVTFDSADVFGGIDDANDPENDAKKNVKFCRN